MLVGQEEKREQRRRLALDHKLLVGMLVSQKDSDDALPEGAWVGGMNRRGDGVLFLGTHESRVGQDRQPSFFFSCPFLIRMVGQRKTRMRPAPIPS